MNIKEKYKQQLGVDYSTAQNQLRKTVLFELVKGANLDVCYRCDKTIETPRQLSIEHIKAWRNEPDAKELFFDLKNITFSHLSCNSQAQSRFLPKTIKGGKYGHPTIKTFRDGCRCAGCRQLIDSKYDCEEQK